MPAFMEEVGENETEVSEFILVGWSGRPKSRMALMTFLIISYSVIIVGNGLIVLLVVYDSWLHNPMYFFLCNLALLDLCLATAAAPQAIANCLEDKPVMSLPMCYTQMYSFLMFGTTECFLLAVMAYDRYMAISNPLHYRLIMNKVVCVVLAIATWTAAFVITVIPTLVKPFRFCGNNEVDHIGCEVKSLLHLVCNDSTSYQIIMFFTSTLTLVLPLGFILFSYICILVAFLKMHSEGGRRAKAFSTCGSHLAVVILYYGTTIFTYLLPQNAETHETDKIIFPFNSVLTPMLNPLIYTLRNQDVIGALKKLISKKNWA